MDTRLTENGLPFFQLTKAKLCAKIVRRQGQSFEFELDMTPCTGVWVSLSAAAVFGRLAAGSANDHDYAALTRCGAWPCPGYGIEQNQIACVLLPPEPVFTVRYRVTADLAGVDMDWRKAVIAAVDNILSAPQQTIATASLTAISTAFGFPINAVRAGNNPASCLSASRR